MGEWSTPIAELALDRPFREHEARERALTAGAMRAARVGTASDVALSAGVAVPREAASLLRGEGDGIPVLRRLSGGTVVLVRPSDILWSVVVPRARGARPTAGLHAYAELGAGIVQALADDGIPAEWTESPGLSAEFCLLGLRGRALSVGGRVVGGAAQHLTAAALLHHGILLRTVDRPLLERLFGLSPETLTHRVTSLDELSVPRATGRLEATILRNLSETASGFAADSRRTGPAPPPP